MSEDHKKALVEMCCIHLHHAITARERDIAMDHFERVRNIVQELHYEVWHSYHTSGEGR